MKIKEPTMAENKNIKETQETPLSAIPTVTKENPDLNKYSKLINNLKQGLADTIIGQDDLLEQILISFFSHGHDKKRFG